MRRANLGQSTAARRAQALLAWRTYIVKKQLGLRGIGRGPVKRRPFNR